MRRWLAAPTAMQVSSSNKRGLVSRGGFQPGYGNGAVTWSNNADNWAAVKVVVVVSICKMPMLYSDSFPGAVGNIGIGTPARTPPAEASSAATINKHLDK